MKKIISFIICMLISSIQFLTAQVNVTPNNVANQLAQKLVGFGVNVTNATLDCGSANSDGINHGSGMFTVTSSNLGIDSGIVLTSGVAASTPSLNGVNGLTGLPSNVTNLIGDPDLTTLVGGLTRDKCILEFDFTTLGDTVSFDYVFGSSEYTSFTCTNFNDVFGFFISGPGIVGPYSNSSKNIALVPGTTSCPVAISTIYCPNSLGCCNTTSYCFGNTAGCTTLNATNNTCQYFVCNANGSTIKYPGFTTVLTAMSPVIPCSTYHLKLAIADKQDNILDSGVFLKAGSLKSNIIQIKLNAGLTSSSGSPVIVEGCDSANLKITRKIVSGTVYADTINLQYGGNAQNSIDYTTLPTQLTFLPNVTDTVKILSLYAFPDGLTEGTEYLKIYVLSGCAQLITDSIIIEIKDSLEYSLFNGDTAICLGSTVNIIGVMDSGMTMQWTPANNVLNPNQFLTSITPTVIGSQKYTITGSYGTCVPVVKSFTITTDPVPILTPISDFGICEGNTYPINAIVTPTFNYNIIWNPSSGLINTNGYNPTFVGTTSQSIQLYIISPNAGCKTSDTFLATVFPFQVGDIKDDTLICDGSPIQLNVTGAPFYYWDPTNYISYSQSNDGLATPLTDITYYVTGVSLLQGCPQIDSFHISVIEQDAFIPSAFTPNGDGVNDMFRVTARKMVTLQEFKVMNRWGQQVFETRDISKGWDGTFKGQPQDSGIYYYMIKVASPTGKIQFLRGDITLIR